MCRSKQPRARRARNPADLSFRSKRGSRKIFNRGLGGPEIFLEGNLRRRRSLRGKGQLEMVDDFVHHRVVGKRSDDPHRSPALETEHRFHFINLADHLSPAPGRDGPELVLNNPDRKSLKTCLLDLSPVGIGVQPVIPHHDLDLIGNMASEAGDKLQIIHPLQLFGSFSISVADFTFHFIKREALQGKERTNHVFAHQLGFFLCLLWLSLQHSFT